MKGNKSCFKCHCFPCNRNSRCCNSKRRNAFKRSHCPREFYCAEQFRSLAQHKGTCDVTLWDETPSRCVNTYQSTRSVSHERRLSFVISLVIPKGINSALKLRFCSVNIPHCVISVANTDNGKEWHQQLELLLNVFFLWKTVFPWLWTKKNSEKKCLSLLTCTEEKWECYYSK